jgi:sialic acid synthase SpsE
MGRKRVFIIAEAGVNHNGQIQIAKQLVEAAARSGADAVKFQTFFAEDSHSTQHVSKKRRAWAKGLELTEEEFCELMDLCQQRDILFLSTPFDQESVNLLERLQVAAYKIASANIVNLGLLEKVARTGKPTILSTGMATVAEIERAVTLFREMRPKHRNGLGKRYPVLASQLVLLHCVSMYPTPYRLVNLRRMSAMEQVFRLPVGFSDHTLGVEIALAAVTMGAPAIEKHITIDRDYACPDQEVSLDPKEFASMVQQIRHLEVAMGDGSLEVSGEEARMREKMRYSVVALRPLKVGMVLGQEDIGVKQPGNGLSPESIPMLTGLTLQKSLKRDEQITWEHVKRQ